MYLSTSSSWKGGTNLIFLTGSKALALSEGGCLPKLAIFNSYSRAATSFLASISAAKWPFLVLLSRASFNSASLKSRAF